MFAVYPIDTEARCFVRRKCRVAAATPDKYECQHCHRTFAKPYNLLIHERIHKDENENTLSGLHPCDICGKVFGKAESLKNHRYVLKNQMPNYFIFDIFELSILSKRRL